MKTRIAMGVVAAILTVSAGAAEPEAAPGSSVESLIEYARTHNPDYAAMRHEATAAGERVQPAGALPDPVFRTELRDVTNEASGGNTSLLPSRVGSTRYLLMQGVPWFGKRDLKREIAEIEARGATARSAGTWNELAARIKSAYAQLYYLARDQRLTREILDLMIQLEKVAQTRYANGLVPQQDAIRAQVEQTTMRNELVALERERRALSAQLNALLARPANAPLAEPQQLRPLPPPARLDYSALADQVRAGNPQLFAEEARVRAAEKNRDLVYKNRYPDFTLGVSPIQMRNRVSEWELMVELNIPLQQGTRRSQERESLEMLYAAQSRREATANQLLSALSENLAGLEAARRTEGLAASSLGPQSDLTFRSALASYETGKLDFGTLIDAQRQIRIAKQLEFKSQAEAQARLAEIERVVGEEL